MRADDDPQSRRYAEFGHPRQIGRPCAGGLVLAGYPGGSSGCRSGEMADAQDLKNHFTLFQPVAHHHFPHAQTIDNELVASVHAFFHSAAKGRGSDPKSSTKSSTDQKQAPKYLLKSCASGKGISPRLVPVLSSGLLKARRPSRMPTRERSAPTSAWSCRHFPQDCAPAALATLWTMPPPPGQGFAVRVAFS